MTGSLRLAALAGLSAIAALCSASLPIACATIARAQSYPARPVRLLVPYAAGGITDVIARALAQRLSQAWRQPVVVENKPGGGAGQVGAELTARSAPDGYTLMLTADATLTTNAHIYEKLAYDPLNDFVPITGLGISPQALIVNPSVDAHSLHDLIELGRRKPGALNYGTFGIGTSGHLNIVLLESITGASFTAVHYRGAAPALTDTIAGHIQMMIVSIGLVVQPWQAGELRVLGFGSATRLAPFLDVPTLQESGLSGYEAGSWYGLVAPKGTPRDIVMNINTEVRRIFDDAQFAAAVLEPNFIYSIVSSPEEFAERIRRDSEKWGKVIRDAHVKAQ